MKPNMPLMGCGIMFFVAAFGVMDVLQPLLLPIINSYLIAANLFIFGTKLLYNGNSGVSPLKPFKIKKGLRILPHLVGATFLGGIAFSYHQGFYLATVLTLFNFILNEYSILYPYGSLFLYDYEELKINWNKCWWWA